MYGRLACGAFLALLSACTKPAATPPQAHAILESAQRYLGEAGTLARITVIDAAAQGSGPDGAFEARVVSARDGDMRMDRSSGSGGFSAGVRAGEGWLLDADSGAASPIDAVMRTFLRGHELHMLVLAPETRLRATGSVETGDISGTPAHVIRFLDELDGPVDIYFSVADGRPLGMKTVNHSGHGERDVYVHFEDWRETGGVRLFHQATFVQGQDRYVYDYRTLDTAAKDVPAP